MLSVFAALLSTAGIGLNSWLSCMLCFLFCHFPILCPESGVIHVFDCIDS